MWPPPGTRTAWGRMPGQLNFRISLFVASGVVSGHGLGLRLQGGGNTRDTSHAGVARDLFVSLMKQFTKKSLELRWLL